MKQRLKRFYQKEVLPRILTTFHYKNVHQVPRLGKIVLNRGIGEIGQNTKILDSLSTELTSIAAQRCRITRARNAIAGFKIRKGVPIGLIVTIRGERIYAFLDRLINLALPRIRDFHGVAHKSFDGKGNYNLGFKDQLIFPEIRYDRLDQLFGLNLSITTTSPNNQVRFELLKTIGIPFR
jgi:large subunit ribosomal protein L5